MVSKKALKSHSAWVSTLAWHPTNPNMFLSGGYDGAVKVWDLRSNVPLHSLTQAHKDKVLCVGWAANQSFLSGGADKTVQIHSIKLD
jgi:ribosome biogenesis protein YTM1